MLGVRGLDYSAGVIPGKMIYDAGYRFVIRYIDDPKVVRTRKHITPAEYRDLVAAGVDVWLVFEVGIGDMLAGRNAGVANARRARIGADSIGYPPGRVIFMACDMHVTAAQLTPALAYIDGAISVLGHDATGVYGFVELTEACVKSGRGAAYWQAGRAPLTGHIHVWQRNDGFKNVGGITCDINELYIQIPREGAAPDEGDDVAIKDDGEKLEPWLGGISNIEKSSNSVDAENYNATQYLMRNNVEVHQVKIAVAALTAKVDALIARLGK